MRLFVLTFFWLCVIQGLYNLLIICLSPSVNKRIELSTVLFLLIDGGFAVWASYVLWLSN